MKVKGSNKILLKQESRTLLEKEFEKAHHNINLKIKEMTIEEYEKKKESSRLKGEECVLEVKYRHLSTDFEDKEKENLGLLTEIKNLEDEISQLRRDVEINWNTVKEKRKKLEQLKQNSGLEVCNKKNDYANENEKSKDEVLQQKMVINSILFSNQIKKEECERLKKELEKIEKQYKQALIFETQGVKKATTIFKEMRDNS